MRRPPIPICDPHLPLRERHSKVQPALTRDRDKVPASIVVKGDMQWLMDIADPMPQAFEEPDLIAHVEAQGKVPRVVQDGGYDTAIGYRATVSNLDAFRRARQVHIMLGRPLTGKHIRPCAPVCKSAKLGVDRNKGIDARPDFRLQLLIGYLADNAVADIAPGEGRRRHQRRTD